MGSWSEDNWDRIMADYQSRHEQAIEQRDEVLFKGHDLFKLPSANCARYVRRCSTSSKTRTVR